MKDQKQIFFGRTMDPCEYDARLASTLREKEDCVVVKAFNGRPKKKVQSTENDLGEK